MEKLKRETLANNITRLILLSIALTIAMVAFISSASAAAPDPNYGDSINAITVDGDYSDWDLDADFFANMYRAGETGKIVESKLYLRYDCTEKRMYTLVLVESQAKALKQDQDAWIKINGDKVTTVGESNYFKWVYDGGNLLGYEASFAIDPGTYKIDTHLQVDDGGSQTSRTDKSTLDLIISCTSTSSGASIGNFVWEDLNRNGVQDEGEPGIDGVTVKLYTCAGVESGTTATQSGGYYLFYDLVPGSYYVEFVLPSEYAFSPLDQGGDDATDSDADTATGITICTDLSEEEYDPTWDAGMYRLVENLEVTKTADTSYTRTHNWEITKSVDTVNNYMHNGFPKIWLYTDGRGDETATWTVDVTYNGYEDSDYAVSGTITIENTGDLPANITSISDVLSDGTSVNLADLPTFPYTLPAGGTLTLNYETSVLSKIEEGSNDVTVTTERDNYDDSADIVWSDIPNTENYKTINVKDSSDLFGEQDLGTVTAPNDQQFTYTKDFAWADYGKDNGGDYTYHNTATIVETGQSDDATLLVNVQKYLYETAYAKGSRAECFIPTFANWGWTNLISPGTYEMGLWAGAAQCDTSKGTDVGSVTVVYGSDGYVTVTYNVVVPYLLEETHVYAGTDMFPKNNKGVQTVAPGAYSNHSPFSNDDTVYVIAHAVIGIPDPNFGPGPV